MVVSLSNRGKALKYYHGEKGSGVVAALFGETGRRIRISRIGLVEVQSALAMKVRSGALRRDDTELQSQCLMADLAAGVIEVYRLTERHCRAAEQLIGHHGFSARLRTLDAMHLDLARQGLVDRLVVADLVLSGVARLESLDVVNPEIGR